MPIRYIVHDVEEAVSFYADRLGFELVESFGSPFAVVMKGDAKLWLSGPASSAARPMPDGRVPEPGGWNRLVVEVEDLETVVAGLRASGVRFRNEPITGPGGTQVLIEDPSGNPVELFQPRKAAG